MVLFEGTVVNEKTSAKSLSVGMQEMRHKIFAFGKVINLVTKVYILFSSSCAATDFILGYSASGSQTWKTKDGRTLNDIENSQVN